MASSSPAKYSLPPSASRKELVQIFARIAEDCRGGRITAALVLAAGKLMLSRGELSSGVHGLSEAGCPPGFRLAFVLAGPDLLDEFSRAEDAGLRDGISMRVFFDEQNALAWLG